MNKLVLATRKSKLAQVQTEIIMESLKNKLNMESEKLLIVIIYGFLLKKVTKFYFR